MRVNYKNSLPPSQQNFKILPDNGKSWRWARMNGTFYYAANRVPNRSPKFYRDMLPSENELIEMANNTKVTSRAELVKKIRTDIVNQVDEFMSNDDVHYYRYISEPVFTLSKAEQLAEAKAWCRMISLYVEGGRFKRLGLNRKEDFFQVCAGIIQERELEGLRIKTVKSLRKKIHNFPAIDESRQRSYLISKKYGNDNARKVGKFKLVDTTTGEELDFDIHEAIMFNLYMNPGKPQKEDMISLWDEYKEWLSDFSTDEPMAYRTFTQYCSRFDNQLKTAKARHGSDYYNKHYLTYTPSEHLNYAHSLFAADGSATVAYKYYVEDKKGNKLCKRMNLYAILISDVASRYIAGFAPAREGFHNETPRMTEQAVKMAIESGGYQTMHEIVTDNHGAFTGAESKQLLNSIFGKVRTIKPNNSQANPAETQFRLFKKTLKRFDNFLRTSWNAGVHNQANPDFIPNNEMLPTYEEAVIQLRKIVEDYNNKPLRDGSTPAQRFERKHPDCKPMDDRQLRHIFGYKTAVEITRMRGYVDVYKGGVLHQFEIPGYYSGMSETIASATGYKPDAKLAVYWTADAADLYTLDGRFLCSCMPSAKGSNAEAERTATHTQAISHNEARKNRQLKRADEFESRARQTADLLTMGAVDAYNIAVTDSNYSKEDFNAEMEEVVGNAPHVKNDFDCDDRDDYQDTDDDDFGANSALDDM